MKHSWHIITYVIDILAANGFLCSITKYIVADQGLTHVSCKLFAFDNLFMVHVAALPSQVVCPLKQTGRE